MVICMNTDTHTRGHEYISGVMSTYIKTDIKTHIHGVLNTDIHPNLPWFMNTLKHTWGHEYRNFLES